MGELVICLLNTNELICTHQNWFSLLHSQTSGVRIEKNIRALAAALHVSESTISDVTVLIGNLTRPRYRYEVPSTCICPILVPALSPVAEQSLPCTTKVAQGSRETYWPALFPMWLLLSMPVMH